VRTADPAWPPLTEARPPQIDEIRVVRLFLDEPADPEDAAVLSAWERERAARFVFPVHRRRFLAAHVAVRRLLALTVECDPAGLTFDYSDRGRPSLRLPADLRLDFNLAHSGDVALFAIARRTVGVDVESVREMAEVLTIARRFFSPRELAVLAGLEGDERQRGFFVAWTRKEAVMKATGAGLGALEETEVTLAPGERPRVVSAPGGGEGWRLLHLEPTATSVGAVAFAESADPVVRLTTWTWSAPAR
jgi:4'-phosphopantetheinyl transferase